MLSLLVALAVSSALPTGSSASASADLQAAPSPRTEQIEACQTCHADTSLTVTLASGEVQKLFVDGDAFAKSVHGQKLSCVDCHSDDAFESEPHDPHPLPSLRQFTLAYYEQCKRCHFDNYAKTLDSTHYAALARGDKTAPVCVDCHGAHGIMGGATPRTRISETCAKCHQGVSLVYAKSVHGKALSEGNTDVPSCTDCHRSHEIHGPRDAAWRARTPELCAHCHSNRTLMAKYDISPNVMQTYLADFHGMTASLRKAQGVDEPGVVALCTDCHGVHDIRKVTDPDARVIRANLVTTCRKCHADATDAFPAAWLSHYEPSWQKTPIVYAVMVGYWILIPFMIGGLALQILLHLWRVVVNR
jgi:predicted CXXCH cytochrome family protein